MPKPKFQIKDFYGAVVLNDWMEMPYGHQAKAIVGRISIYRDVEMIGFVAERSANWVARVVSESDPTNTLTILGCQIRAIHTLSEDRAKCLGAAYWKV